MEALYYKLYISNVLALSERECVVEEWERSLVCDKLVCVLAEELKWASLL